MESGQVLLVNAVFGWTLVALSVIGFVLTARKMGEKWAAWLVLGAGWALFALAQSLAIAYESIGMPLLVALWLSSFVLILTAILLMFLKLIRLRGRS